MFTIHWKHLSSKPLHASPSFDSSSYLNGWFKDYLWFNSSALIRGYDISGSNSLFPYSWLFLGAHLLWATSFMFLISWRGYLARRTYRHLILHAHPNSILILTREPTSVTPTALSIMQARLTGVTHFASGFILTYAAFIIRTSS